MSSTALLIIDAQYDFCHPQGALFVPGANEDMRRLAAFIKRNEKALAYICATIDSHPINDISHPAFWQDASGKQVAPFTQITAKEVRDGHWQARFAPEKALAYIEALEAQGQFPHFIWPEHCIIGSQGQALESIIMEALKDWSRLHGREYATAHKGTYPLTEHFGIFMAQIPDEAHPETQLNTTLINTLLQYEQVLVAGEAKSHCVATSIKQAMDYAPELASKMMILEDCMSDVSGLGHLGAPVYEEARQRGLRFAQAATLQL